MHDGQSGGQARRMGIGATGVLIALLLGGCGQAVTVQQPVAASIPGAGAAGNPAGTDIPAVQSTSPAGTPMSTPMRTPMSAPVVTQAPPSTGDLDESVSRLDTQLTSIDNEIAAANNGLNSSEGDPTK